MAQKLSPANRRYWDVCRRHRPRPAAEAKIIKNHGNLSKTIKNNVFFTNFVWTVLHHYLELGAGIWTGAKRDSQFSFYEKKIVEKIRSEINFDRKKIDQKKNSVGKLLVDKNFGRLNFWSAKFLVEFFFRSKKIDPKKYFSTNFFFRPKCFWIFFSTKKTFDEKILGTYSDGEFPQDSENHT